MALKSTIFRLTLNVSDMDRSYYGEHSLTVARHPSENDERMMVRVLAFALFAADDLRFGRGLSAEDEADLHAEAPDGTIRLWIDVGLPDDRLVKKAAARADRVVVLAYLWAHGPGLVAEGPRDTGASCQPAGAGHRTRRQQGAGRSCAARGSAAVHRAGWPDLAGRRRPDAAAGLPCVERCELTPTGSQPACRIP